MLKLNVIWRAKKKILELRKELIDIIDNLSDEEVIDLLVFWKI